MHLNSLGIWFSMILSILVLSFCGCDSGNDNSSDGSNASTNTSTPTTSTNNFVGSWALCDGTNPNGTVVSYVHFEEDKSFVTSDSSDKNRPHCRGTYTISDAGLLVGPFTNPNVGDGRVECTVSNGVLTMDFIEYWHTPNKHCPYAGKKM